MIFEGYAKATARIAGLQVQHATLGKEHRFSMQGVDCAIILPSADQLGDSLGPVRREESYVDASDEDEQTWFGIYRVAVVTSLPHKIEHEGDETTFRSPAVTRSSTGQWLRQQVPSLLAEALDHWLRVIRCETLSPLVRLSGEDAPGFTGGFRVFRVSDDRPYDAHGGAVYLEGSNQICSNQWKQIELLLYSGYKPSLWLDYLTDGMQRFRNNELGGAIVSTAIACETVIRAVFWSHVPPVTNAAAAHVIDTASVQVLLGKWDVLSGIPKADLKSLGKSEVHKVFDTRNLVMHKGDTSSLNNEYVGRLINGAKKFIQSADILLRQPSVKPGAIGQASGYAETA